MAVTAFSTVLKAVIKIKRVSRCRSRIWASKSMPLAPGIFTSEMTRL